MKRIALIGTGRMGVHHARTLVEEVSGVELVALCTPRSPRLGEVAAELGVPDTTRDPQSLAAREDLDGVVLTTPADTHVGLVEAFAAAGKHVFVEKPLATTLSGARSAEHATREAGVVLQVGFNRRFAESWTRARELVTAGAVGEVQRAHSLTRDPGPWRGDPDKVLQDTIFLQTLIHDFDVLNWLNPGAEPVSVHAVADALIRPDARDRGFLDTAVVLVRYSNGAIATAEASFSASYGYDLRAEVFGSGGMVQMGDPVATSARLFDASGLHGDTAGTDTSRYHDSFRRELQAFSDLVNGEDVDHADGADGVRAQLVATAAIRSVAEGRPVGVEEVGA
jgi:Predicted dehydrogenases and related proteins